MSLNIGELVAYVKVDHSGVGQGITAAQRDMRSGMDRMAGDAKAQGTRAGQEAGKGLTSGFRASVGNLAKVAVGAFAVERVVAGLRAAKDAASDLNETTSMSSVIFGQNADAMKAWATEGPRALGLSTEAALRAAAGYADMFLQLGFAQDKAVQMSQATVQLAADLGSFKNLETGDVLERIAAGFRGEYDSLQLLIPNISAARVEKEAMAQTGQTTAAALTAEQKAAATLAIIQKDGARARGDYARTADGEANASKTAAAMTEDLAAQIGQGLLPVYTSLVVFGRDEVIPFLSKSVDYLGAVADAAQPVTGAVGGMVGAFREMPGPVQAATLGIIGLVALRGRVSAFGDTVQGKLSGASAAGSKALDGLRLSIMYASETAETRAGRFGAVTKAIGASAGQGLRGAAGGVIGLLGGPWGVAFTGAVTVLGAWLNKQADAKKRADDLTASLNQQTGAITEQTKVQLAKELQDRGVLDMARELGVSQQLVVDAYAGSADALGQLIAMQEAAARSSAILGGRTGEVADRLDSATAGQASWAELTNQSAQATGRQAGDLAGLLNIISPTNAEMANLTGAQKEVADAAGVAADSTTDLGDATKTTTGKVADLSQGLKDAAQATLDLLDAQLASSDAELSYQKSRSDALQTAKDYSKELPKNAKAFDLTTEAGQRAQQNLLDLARDAKSKAKADAEAGASLSDLRQGMKDSQADFIATAHKLGLSEDAAKAMAKEWGLTTGTVDNLAMAVEDLPASKEIRIEAETAAAEERLAAIKRQLATMKNKTVTVTTVGRVVSVSDPTGSGSRATSGGQTIDSARGNILRFATGTEDHRAFIAGRGTPVRVFNEPETGGEAYIPLAPDGRRPRAVGIVQQVADEFGYSLAPKGAGAAGGTHVTNQYTTLNIREVRPNDYGDLMDQMHAETHASRIAGGIL